MRLPVEKCKNAFEPWENPRRVPLHEQAEKSGLRSGDAKCSNLVSDATAVDRDNFCFPSGYDFIRQRELLTYILTGSPCVLFFMGLKDDVRKR